jgi:hypothetical protein
MDLLDLALLEASHRSVKAAHSWWRHRAGLGGAVERVVGSGVVSMSLECRVGSAGRPEW